MPDGENIPVELELIVPKPYSADSVGAIWNRKGDRQKVRPRLMNDWDIQAGLKKGILKVVKEKVEKKKGGS